MVHSFNDYRMTLLDNNNSLIDDFKINNIDDIGMKNNSDCVVVLSISLKDFKPIINPICITIVQYHQLQQSFF